MAKKRTNMIFNKIPRKHRRYCWKVILLFAVVVYAPCLPLLEE